MNVCKNTQKLGVFLKLNKRQLQYCSELTCVKNTFSTKYGCEFMSEKVKLTFIAALRTETSGFSKGVLLAELCPIHKSAFLFFCTFVRSDLI